MNTQSLTVKAVETAKDLDEFFAFKYRLYRDDPAVVFPLKSMERAQLDPDKHPFYEHARRELFLATRNGETVGRIAAIKDDLHNEFHSDSVGFFGFYESVDDQEVAKALVGAAVDWLKTEGCDQVRGPVNPSMKSDFGVTIQGHHVPPMVMMGHSPKYYEDLLLNEGFSPAMSFYTLSFYSKDQPAIKDRWEGLAEAEEKIRKRYPKLELRKVTAENFEVTLRDINELGNKVRAEVYGFVPLTDNELDFMVSNLRRVIRYDMIHVAYWEGQLIGYIVNVPDVNWALRKTWGKADWLRMIQLPFLMKRTPRTRVIALGVDRNFRKKGAAMVLINQLVKKYRTYKEWEFSWVAENNLNSLRIIERTLPLVKNRVYRLYERGIDAPDRP